MTTTEQVGGASPADFEAFGDYRDYLARRGRPQAGSAQPGQPVRHA
jgi:hypothetical protein